MPRVRPIERPRRGSLHQNQEAHRKKMDFDAEFLTLLKKQGMQFDAKYVFG